MRLISNSGDADHSSEIIDLLKRADRAWLFVAYLRSSGLDLLNDSIQDAAKKIPIEFYCDIGSCVSQPEALHKLFRMLKKTSGKLYLVGNPEAAFHSKAYCFFEGRDVHLVVGSANATRGGLQSNIEASLMCTLPAGDRVVTDLKKFHSSILRSACEADAFNLKQYEERYRIVNRKRKQAEKDAAAEIKQNPLLDSRLLAKLLAAYKRDPGEQSDYSDRIQRYGEAKTVLDQMCSRGVKTREEFTALYGQLVGAAGKRKLWHSGGVHRSKGSVANYHREVVELVHQLGTNSFGQPGVVFETGRRIAQTIPGLGVNVVTEIMNTLDTKRFAVLNQNPLMALTRFGLGPFRQQGQFRAADYEEFIETLRSLAEICGFNTLGQVDHFLNYVFQDAKKSAQTKTNALTAGRLRL